MTFDEFVKKYQKVPVEEYPNNVLEKIPEPLVSCRVSTYQHAPYIRQCLDSILMQQTDFPFEIIIGEDESNDGTRQICLDYARRYPDKIRLFLHHRENNIIIDGKPTPWFQSTYTSFKSRGKYLASCEGDDYWADPLKLQKQIEFLEKHPDCMISFHDAAIIDENGNPSDVKVWNELYKRDLSPEELVKGYYIPLLSAVIRAAQYRMLLKNNKMSLSAPNGDVYVFALLAEFGYAHFHPDIKPGCYRIHNQGFHSGIDEKKRVLNRYKTQTELYRHVSNKHRRIVRRNMFYYQKSLSKFRINEKDFFLSSADMMMKYLWVHPYSFLLLIKLFLKYGLVKAGILCS